VSGKTLNIIKKAALYLAGKKFCRQAIEERADLIKIREKPSKSAVAGLILIAFSYVIGLPAVIFMGIMAVWMKEPLVGIVGGPLIYAISTIIFIIGIKLAGKKYFVAFLKWSVRVVLEKILGSDARLISGDECSKKQ
jgi:hypothetical protein